MINIKKKNEYKQGFTPTPFKKKGVSLEIRRGFTLIETLIALSIFSVSILGLMLVLAQGISDTTYAKKKHTAAYLAQEGIEYIRNIRDTYVLYYSATGPVGWIAFNTKMTEPSASCDEVNGCYFDDQDLDYNNNTQPITGIYMIACGATCANLLYDSFSGKYNYLLGEDSGFTRKIQVVTINANETKVFSTVYWIQGSGTYHLTFSESLFNWVE